MIRHRRYRILAATRIDFPLDSRDDRELEQHLDSCVSCRRVADGLAADQLALAGVRRDAAPVRAGATSVAAAAPIRVRVQGPALGMRSPQLAAGALVLLLFAGIALVGSRLRVAGPAPTPTTSATTSASSAASASPSASQDIGSVVAMVRASAALAAEPQFCPGNGSWDCVVGIAAGGGAVWTTSGRTVARIDPATNRVVATIDVGSDPRRIVFDGEVVWVTVAAGDLVGIDPATNTITRRIPVGAQPAALAIGGGDLWVVLPVTNQVIRVDPSTAKVVATIEVTARPWGIAVDGGSAWVASYGGGIGATTTGAVTRIDAATNTVVDTIPLPEAREVTVAFDSVWVAGHDQVTRLDESTGNIRSSAFVGNWPNVVAFDGSVWVSSAINSDVRRWNVATDQIDGTIPLGPGNGSYETAMAVGDGDLWFRSYAADVYRLRPVAP
ncbi:MAG TPA: hypothetical protein VGO64_05850 [Candidatus Limnocylindrales bacterium]|nr:hypothetical protein [Candidatus Limnocylindrales bacterium]